MKKLLLALAIIISTSSLQGMGPNFYPFFDLPSIPFSNHNRSNPYAFINYSSPEELKKKYEESALQSDFAPTSLKSFDGHGKATTERAEQFNQNNPLFLLPRETLDHILSYCQAEDKDQVKSLEKSIKTFLQLSRVCKNFNTLLTFETIGKLCKNYELVDKNNVLKKLLETINNFTYKTKRPCALVLVYAGADVNTQVSISDCLLGTATIYSDEQMIEILFKHNADPNVKSCANNPLIFYVTTIKTAQMFIDNGVDIHATSSYIGTNILWNILYDSGFHHYPSELVELYLKYQVNATQLNSDDNSCLLHKHAGSSYSKFIKDTDNFLKKGTLLLNAMPKKMINALNKQGQTPVDIALASLEEVKRYKCTKSTTAYEQLIVLYRAYGGLTAQELREQQAIVTQ